MSEHEKYASFLSNVIEEEISRFSSGLLNMDRILATKIAIYLAIFVIAEAIARRVVGSVYWLFYALCAAIVIYYAVNH